MANGRHPVSVRFLIPASFENESPVLPVALVSGASVAAVLEDDEMLSFSIFPLGGACGAAGALTTIRQIDKLFQF